MSPNLMLVYTNAVGGQEAVFNQWYDERHLGDILDVPGVVSAQRYALAPMAIPEGDDVPAQLPPPAHRYLTVYEFEGDPDDVMSEFVARAGTDRMQLSDALDLSTVSVATWVPSGPRRSSTGS
ncbi:hypothetical protein JVX93_19390 [Mycolicibacterium boenickei]|nr:hypothetical protein JVX93_19390 [Mycolicibacterium boenickei]